MKPRSVHIQALMVWFLYSILTKGVFLAGLGINFTLLESLFFNLFVNSFFGIMFLYFFSHEDFFKFAGEIRRKNINKEKKLEGKFRNLGSVAAVVLMGILGGPMVCALGARFLIPLNTRKYLLVAISSAIGATIWFGLAKGLISRPY